MLFPGLKMVLNGVRLLAVLLVCALPLRAQILTPTKTEALVVLHVVNSQNKPVGRIPVTIENESTKTQYRGVTNFSGYVEILAPCGANYLLHFEQARSYARFTLPREKYYTFSQQVTFDGKPVLPDRSLVIKGDTTFFYGDSSQNLKATYSIVLLHFTLTDYKGQPLDSEVVTMKGMRSGKFFKGITGRDGEVFMLLPKGDQYTLDFPYEKEVDHLDYPMEAGFRSADVTYQYEGSRKAKKRIAAENERLAREEKDQREFNKQEFERMSAAYDEYQRKKKIQDSIAHSGKPKELPPDTLIITPVIGKLNDPVVTDVLVRNFFWNPQLFVTDLTGSMSPYTKQLGTWFKEKIKTNPDINILFFNDGDGKPDAQKTEGNAGGLHYCLKCSEPRFEKTVSETVAAGTGGDAPENNIEALLAGIERVKPTQPVVMIVDNKAPVRDIALLEKVTVPVRIILCGVNGPIHPDYIRIAYATKGSLHTLKEDVYKLPEIAEGRIVTIAGYKYAYSRGRFVLLT